MKNTSYARSRDKAPFNWSRFLNRKRLTDKDWEGAYTLSTDWVTCACGNQCAVIPRTSTGEPLDFRLSNLGLDFMSAIKDKNATKGKRLLRYIEKCSLAIIKQLNKEAKLA